MISFDDWIENNKSTIDDEQNIDDNISGEQEEDELTELSKTTMDSYRQKATNEYDIARSRAAINARKGKTEDANELNAIADKRKKGLDAADDLAGAVVVKYKENGVIKTKLFCDSDENGNFTKAKSFAKMHPGSIVV